MRKSQPLSRLMQLPYCLPDLLESLIKSNNTKIYFYLTLSDNPKLNTSAFFELQNVKKFLIDLSILCAKLPDNDKFFELRLEVIHSIVTDSVNDDTIFKPVNEVLGVLTCEKKKENFKKLNKKFPNGYTLSPIPKRSTVKEMMEIGYGEASATAECKWVHIGPRENIDDTFMTTVKIIQPGDILIDCDSDLVIERNNMSTIQIIHSEFPCLNPDSPQYNEKIFLMLMANKALVDKDGKCGSYNNRFEAFLTKTDFGKNILSSLKHRGISLSKTMLERTLPEASSPLISNDT
jgi:hypothetical protein